MSRSALALLIFLAGFMALAQPGLCPCWLVRDVRLYHPHPGGHPERPHSHGYLLELFNAESAAVASPLPIPARTLILFLALSTVWWCIGGYAPALTGWASPPSTPPPRGAASP